MTCHLVSRVPPPQLPAAAQQVTAALTAKARMHVTSICAVSSTTRNSTREAMYQLWAAALVDLQCRLLPSARTCCRSHSREVFSAPSTRCPPEVATGCAGATSPARLPNASSAVQTDERAEARLAGLTELYNVLTDAGARLGVLTAVLAFARDADLAHHLLPVIQVPAISWTEVSRPCRSCDLGD